MALFVLTLSFVGAAKANVHHEDENQNEDLERAVYDFYEICPSGQTLYYKKVSPTSLNVRVCPKESTPALPYGQYPPTGNLIIPETVVHDGITYTVTGIADNTFNNCVGLTGDIVIPNTVTTIGSGAFAFCSGFTGTLTLSESLTSIGGQAFYECTGIHGDLTIPNGVTSIQGQTFWMCSNLTGTLTLPNALTYIGTNAFEDCGFTGPLVIPNTVKTIADYAFTNCSGFTGDLIIPGSVTLLREGVFKGCSGFNGDLVIPGSFTYFFADVFKGCSHIQAIYFYRETTPTFVPGANVSNVFSGISGNKPFYVPNPSNFSGWTYFTNKQQRYFFTGSSNANWSDANNWSPSFGNDAVIVADCEVNNTSTATNITIIRQYNLSIEPGNTLTVNGTITNKGTAANLIIEDGGQLMHHQDGILATVKKNISAYSSDNDGWHLIASSLASNSDVTTVENLLSNTYDLFYYDEPTAYWMNQMDATNNFTALQPGKGYLYANSEDVTLEFAGALRNGTESFTVSSLSYQGEVLKGFNLIGNPYAHNVTTLTMENVAAQGCYRMDGTTDLVVSEVTANDPLKPGEGIFVLATGENASVTFNTTTTKMRNETENTGSICMEVLENGRISDRLLVKRNEGSDFQKLSFRDDRTKLFATRDNEELAIVSCNNDEQAVNFKTAKNGTYTISVTLKDIEVEYLHLIDNLTGNNVDLLVNPTYTFDAKTTDYASRFRLVFSPEAIENENSDSFAFVANGEFIIANEGMATLQVIDLTGRILSTETIKGSFNMPISLSSGVYMLRLINGNDVKTQKIVVE
jgi:hypothetical protein